YCPRALHRPHPVPTRRSSDLAPTLQLTAAALMVAWAIAIALTLATAGRPGRLGRIGSALEVVFAALPHFWLGVVLLVVFAVVLWSGEHTSELQSRFDLVSRLL